MSLKIDLGDGEFNGDYSPNRVQLEPTQSEAESEEGTSVSSVYSTDNGVSYKVQSSLPPPKTSSKLAIAEYRAIRDEGSNQSLNEEDKTEELEFLERLGNYKKKYKKSVKKYPLE